MNRIPRAGFLLLLIGASPLQGQQGDHHSHTSDHPGPAGEAASPLLEQQLETLRTATAKYRDIEVARAEGFRRFGSGEGPLMGEHWYRQDLVDEPLDLARPSTLQYAVIGGERVLVGVAYTLYQRPGEPLPEGFDGPADAWHVHDVLKLARTAVAGRPLLRWVVERRIDRGKVGLPGGRTNLVMVHAWPWLENPDGPFAETHRALPYLRAGLPAEYAVGADENAAWGVALLADSGCAAEIARVDLLASPARDQRRAIERACREAAARVRAADRSSADTLNAVAAQAWTDYLSLRDGTLSAAQVEKMQSAVEHPMGDM